MTVNELAEALYEGKPTLANLAESMACVHGNAESLPCFAMTGGDVQNFWQGIAHQIIVHSSHWLLNKGSGCVLDTMETGRLRKLPRVADMLLSEAARDKLEMRLRMELTPAKTNPVAIKSPCGHPIACLVTIEGETKPVCTWCRDREERCVDVKSEAKRLGLTGDFPCGHPAGCAVPDPDDDEPEPLCGWCKAVEQRDTMIADLRAQIGKAAIVVESGNVKLRCQEIGFMDIQGGTVDMTKIGL